MATLATPVDRTVGTAAETEQPLAIADPMVAGVVGWVDLTAPAFADGLTRLRGTRLVGVRHAVPSEPDWLCRAEVRVGLRALAAEGLAFDLLVRPHQLPAVIETVRAVPELTFVLDHLGNPPRRDRRTGAVGDVAAHTRRGVQHGGQTVRPVTVADWTSWAVEELWPHTDVALTAFGPDRLMYGSDWPVCLLAGTYARVHATMEQLTGHLSLAERDLVFHDTAQGVYSLKR